MKYKSPMIVLLALLGLAFFSPAADASTCHHSDSNLLVHLLNEPAPAPDWRDLPRERLFPVFDGGTDSLLTLLNRWKITSEDAHGWYSNEQPERPSDEIKQLLLVGCEVHPEFLPDLLIYLNDTSETYDAVYACFLNGLEEGLFDDDAQFKIKDWLMIRSKYFREELIEQAKSIHQEEYHFLEKEEYFEHLATIDWETAEELLVEFSSNKIPHIATYALCLRYKHADKNQIVNLRPQLINIVNNNSVPAFARDMACETILNSNWSKKDEWFIEQLQSLPRLEEEDCIFSPLKSYTATDPDRYIPIVTQFIGSTNKVAHNNAVQCLVQFQIEKAREDALRPLLPWLDNPKWADGYDGRLRLIQSLDRVQIPESVPGLIWVVKHGRDYEISGAADALVHYHATNAVPDLKKSLGKERGYTDQRSVISAIHKLGGFTDAEISEALIAYFTDEVISEQKPPDQSPTAQYPREYSEPTSVAMGRQLCTYVLDAEDWTGDLNDHFLKNINQLDNPALAEAIESKLESWLLENDNAALLKDLEKNADSYELWIQALERRDELREQCHELLVNYSTGNDRLSILATVILGSSVDINRILEKGNCDSCITLLACSRLIREDLPVSSVTNLYGTGCNLLDLTIRRYLTEFDSEGSRAALQKLNPQKKLYTGYGRFYSANSTDHFPKSFTNLLEHANPPNEVYALLHGGEGGADDIIITVYSNSAKMVISQWNDRFQNRELPLEEVNLLTQFVSQNQFDALPPLQTSVCGGVDYNYYHVTPDGGRSVYINNPRFVLSEAPVYYALVELFQSFCDQEELTLHYSVEDDLDDFEILINGHDNPVRTVCIQDDRVYVFAGDYEEERWHSLEENTLGKETEQPAICAIIGAYDDIPEDFRYSDYMNPYPWKSGHDDWAIRAAEDEDRNDALWRCKKDSSPQKLMDGFFSNPMVSSDGRWVVAAKCLEDWAHPNTLIRYDLTTNKEYVIDLPPADDFYPIAYIPLHQKFLIYHDGEFLLLDPTSGVSEKVEGEFDPITLDADEMFRPLQKSSEPDCYWVAMGGDIGLYNMRDFSFSPVLNVPELYFNSMEMWIDEENGKVYLAINGDLLRVALVDNSAKVEQE